MKQKLSIIGLVILVFYHIYPQALSTFGFSFIFSSGIAGLLLYLSRGEQYEEVKTIGLIYLPMVILAIISGFVNGHFDPYVYNFAKSELSWMFSSYLIVAIFFIIHKNGKFQTLLYYIIAAVLLQGIISVAMYMNPAIDHFFSSIQMADAITRLKRADTEGQRLLGYGTAFFGTGMIYGIALVMLAYVIMTNNLKFIQLVLISAVYAAIFYIGLMSARTTLIGFGVSLVLMPVIVLFSGNKGNVEMGQFFKFLLIGGIFVSVGYTLSYIYFSQFADWAFEAFINYQKTGDFHTRSSDGISNMVMWGNSVQVYVIGYGVMDFWGSDVGYTRLLAYLGIPGIIAFFGFQVGLLRLSASKNRPLNLMLLATFIYILILNYKGLADLNFFTFIFAFYFMHYKHNIIEPEQARKYRLMRQKAGKQTPKQVQR